jgi:hypothetical protein
MIYLELYEPTIETETDAENHRTTMMSIGSWDTIYG